MKGKLVYLVDDIETSFVINDIRRIAERYQSVVLMSIDAIDKKELLPSNVLAIDNFMDWKRYNKGKILMSNFALMLWMYLSECFSVRKVLPLKKTLALIGSNIFKAEELQRQLKNLNLELKDIELFYSFWFYDCIYLAWMKRLFPSIKIVTRTHSGDLYEDHISIRDNILLRHFQFNYLDAVYPVSDMGTEYLRKRYPKYQEKIHTVFLGTKDYQCMNPFVSEELVMVSCASFRHHKRIHKIAEALLSVESNITWYHFGNENLHTNDPKIPEYIEMKSRLKEKPNVRYIPMGFTENEDLMSFYKKTPVSFFISLSAAEGIPVSIMEVISFGIPVLSTDVGGCAEIVNDVTGKLIPLKTDLKTIAEWIDGFPSSKMNTEAFRTNVREFWKSKYHMDTNYNYFFNRIEAL